MNPSLATPASIYSCRYPTKKTLSFSELGGMIQGRIIPHAQGFLPSILKLVSGHRIRQIFGQSQYGRSYATFLIVPSLLTGHRILNLCDVGKMRSVGNAQASHSVSVSPLLGRRGKRSVHERECHFIHTAKNYTAY